MRRIENEKFKVAKAARFTVAQPGFSGRESFNQDLFHGIVQPAATQTVFIQRDLAQPVVSRPAVPQPGLTQTGLTPTRYPAQPTQLKPV